MPDGLNMQAKQKLDATLVRSCTVPGRYFDSRRNGLFLLIHKNGRKYWLQRFKINGKTREAGLGTYPDVSLADARKKAARNHVSARDGIDPVARRRKAIKTRIAGGTPRFDEIAREAYDKLVLTFKNPEKDGPRWFNGLVNHAFPYIGKLPVDEITPGDIEDMLMANNLWLEKADLSRRILQRTRHVLRYAIHRGHRKDDPTSAIEAILLPQKKKNNPMRSLPYQDVPAAIALIRNKGGWPPVRLAMEFQALTAVRPGEARLARWSEIDRNARTWTIPAGRTKMEREHVVPLSDQALAVLEAAQEFAHSDTSNDPLVFPSVNGKTERPLSDVIFSKNMRELGLDAVPHGFRSSFRTWTQEQTNARDRVAEAALAHVNKNRVEAAYARSDYLDQRRPLMQMWADYLDGKGAGEEVRIGAKAKE